MIRRLRRLLVGFRFITHDLATFTEKLNNKEFIKMIVRNMYAFFVVERALLRSHDKVVNEQIANEILANIKSLSDKSLKRKWTKLYETV